MVKESVLVYNLHMYRTWYAGVCFSIHFLQYFDDIPQFNTVIQTTCYKVLKNMYMCSVSKLLLW